MKRNVFSNLLGLFLLSFSLGNLSFTTLENEDTPDAIIGEWLLSEEEGVVKINKENGTYVGKIIWLDTDKFPDTKRNAEVMAIQLLKDLQSKDNNTFVNGKIYSMERERYYDCDVVLSGEVLNFQVRAGMFTKKISWKRAPEDFNYGK